MNLEVEGKIKPFPTNVTNMGFDFGVVSDEVTLQGELVDEGGVTSRTFERPFPSVCTLVSENNTFE